MKKSLYNLTKNKLKFVRNAEKQVLCAEMFLFFLTKSLKKIINKEMGSNTYMNTRE